MTLCDDITEVLKGSKLMNGHLVLVSCKKKRNNNGILNFEFKREKKKTVQQNLQGLYFYKVYHHRNI